MKILMIVFGGVWIGSAFMILLTLLLIATHAPFIGNWNMALIYIVGIGIGAAVVQSIWGDT